MFFRRLLNTTAAPSEDSKQPWVTSDAAWAIAGVFAWASFFVTCRQIYLHLKYYNNPKQQKWIVRILFMAPIYSFCSWMSLKFFQISIYFDAVRNVYEALVIYYFLALCFEYLGGESAILAALKDRENKPMWLTCTCCLPPFPYGVQFLRWCKQGCLQFCVIKPLMALVTIITAALGAYDDGDLRPDGGYLYVAIVYNISISIALIALILFYAATRDLLAPYRPVLKFLTVKSIIFFAFWQGIALVMAEGIGMIKSEGDVNAGELAIAYQNFMICIEMFFASWAMYYGFSYEIYKHPDNTEAKGPHRPSKIAANLKKTLSPQDIIDDTIRNFNKKYKQYSMQVDHEEAGVDASEDEKSPEIPRKQSSSKFQKLSRDADDLSSLVSIDVNDMESDSLA
eukprot:m.25674 g.25674  ORF g.25674 m.25674 type:complete len:397 (+) comp7730_c0_seq1:304-1494(+)